MGDGKSLEISHDVVDDISILKLSGFLDANTAPHLESNIEGLINKSGYKIIVNFNDLDYISSAGLGVFMSQIETIRDNNGDLKMSNMQKKVYSVFELLGFPMIFEICDTQEECIKKFGNGKVDE